jgi:hypothetical protein
MEQHHRLLKLKQPVDSPFEKLDDLLGYLEKNWDVESMAQVV